jgi:hypothetical protein
MLLPVPIGSLRETDPLPKPAETCSLPFSRMVWSFSPFKVYSGVGADIVMETLIDPESANSRSALTLAKSALPPSTAWS